MRLLVWLVLILTTGAGQTGDTLKSLNSLLASSCYNRPVLQASADGTVLRKDADGGTMTFKLADIGDVTIDADTQAHVLLTCKTEAPCIARSDTYGVTTRLRFMAFSINGLDAGEAAQRLFKELRESAAGEGATDRVRPREHGHGPRPLSLHGRRRNPSTKPRTTLAAPGQSPRLAAVLPASLECAAQASR